MNTNEFDTAQARELVDSNPYGMNVWGAHEHYELRLCRVLRSACDEIDRLRTVLVSVSSAYDNYMETDILDTLADAIGSMRALVQLEETQ